MDGVCCSVYPTSDLAVTTVTTMTGTVNPTVMKLLMINNFIHPLTSRTFMNLCFPVEEHFQMLTLLGVSFCKVLQEKIDSVTIIVRAFSSWPMRVCSDFSVKFFSRHMAAASGQPVPNNTMMSQDESWQMQSCNDVFCPRNHVSRWLFLFFPPSFCMNRQTHTPHTNWYVCFASSVFFCSGWGWGPSSLHRFEELCHDEMTGLRAVFLIERLAPAAAQSSCKDNVYFWLVFIYCTFTGLVQSVMENRQKILQSGCKKKKKLTALPVLWSNLMKSCCMARGFKSVSRNASEFLHTFIRNPFTEREKKSGKLKIS